MRAQTYGTFHIPTSWAWRIPSALQGLPSVFQICLIWFVPESPRWLVSKGRFVIIPFSPSQAVLRGTFDWSWTQGCSSFRNAGILPCEWERVSKHYPHIFPVNDDIPFDCRQDPLVEYEFKEIKAAIDFDRTVASNIGWTTLLTTPGNRRRLRIIIALAIFSQWSGNGLVWVLPPLPSIEWYKSCYLFPDPTVRF